MIKHALVGAMLALGWLNSAAAETVRCNATRDVWLSSIDNERDFNMGAAAAIKLKTWQEFGLVDFDVSALKGRKIGEAWLYVKPAGGQRFGLNGGTDLKWLTLSTVSHDWVEGKSNRNATDEAGKGATFNESSYKQKDWGWPGAKVWDVILGNGNTLRFDGMLVPANGWLKIKIDQCLVAAMVAGASYGLLLMDGSVGYAANCMIASRESGKGPYLEVTVTGANAPPPPPPGVRVVPAPNWAGTTLGALQIALAVPTNAFAYKVKINGAEVERWQIPFAGATREQVFPVVDLPPGAAAAVEVAAVDGSGNASRYVAVQGQVSPKLTVPALPESPFKPQAGEPKALGSARVWAFPEITKVSPISGAVLNEQGTGSIRNKNAVWDGASGTIRLAAARAEIISFQVAIEGIVSNCTVEVSNLTGAAGVVANKGVKIWRNWYVGEHAEYALPLAGAFSCPAPDNQVTGQTLQAVTVDYHIPRDTPAGDYQGMVTIAAGKDKLQLPFKVRVYDVTIPDDIHFSPELNCYNGPGRAGSARFNNSHKLAHYHRATINRVPYGQSGGVHGDWVPVIDDKGHATDWGNFDKNLGDLLDGSLFKDNPRAGVPVPSLYLPIFEGWPKNFRKHYNPGEGVETNCATVENRLKHDTLAKPIEEALDQEFKTAWVNCVADFVAHFKEKGWNRTAMQLYLNNKPHFGYTAWILDEPFTYLDWRALNYFGRLFKQAIDDPEVYTPAWHQAYFEKGLAAMQRSRPTFLFRGDISRPAWQGSVSDGLMTIMYPNSGAFNLPRLIRNSKVRMPALMHVYGSCNAVGQNNWQSAAWCLSAYTHDMDGVLPWQSLAGADAMRKPNEEALIIDAGPYGDAIASFRVHALRRGAQDCELLRLLQLKNGWSREHIGLLVAQKVPLAAGFKQKHQDEAAAVTYGTLTGQGFCELKEGVLQLLAVSPAVEKP